jgi:3-hydroxyethyl bacteriochlorophyllide a dehydrogenase
VWPLWFRRKADIREQIVQADAILIREPKRVEFSAVALTDPTDTDLVVETAYSGVSTGTEKLFWSGEMPPFPGMGYPLIPGYESVGRVVEAGPEHRHRVGEFVFVPGANCYGEIRGLFGASASRIVVPAARALTIDEGLGERGALLALAATAWHASAGHRQPDLIVGHGVVGRLLARIAVLHGAAPVVWEISPARRGGAEGYEVIDPAEDTAGKYQTIYDASGNAALLDTLISRLSPGGEICLAGFYDKIGFAFAPAFMREVRLRIAAQWQPADLLAVKTRAEAGALSLKNLISHHALAADAACAYQTAFEDADCLKLMIDWSVS